MSSACLLLADSRILVTPQKAVRINQRLRNRFTKPVKAAYVGAANADDPAFYELARQSLDDLFSVPCKTLHVKNSANLPEVDVVLLAGGNVSLGWQWLQQTEVLHWLQRCRAQPNSLFIGVSAGAIHLARGCDPEQTQPFIRPYLDWLPMIVAVHEEQQEGNREPHLEVDRQHEAGHEVHGQQALEVKREISFQEILLARPAPTRAFDPVLRCAVKHAAIVKQAREHRSRVVHRQADTHSHERGRLP